MAETEQELQVERLNPGERATINTRRRLSKELAREESEAISQNVAAGILDQAVKGGFSVHEKTAEALARTEQAEVPEEVPPEAPPPDPVDAIVDSLSTELEEKVEQAVVEEEPDDDEFQTPDFEKQADEELLNEEISAGGDEGFVEVEWEDETPVDREDRRARIIAEKKAAFYENLTAQRERKKWEREADEHYGMWRARGEINVTSRRAFLKAAKEAHEAVKPFVKQAVKTREEQMETERASMRSEEKEKAAEAWGKPTVAQNESPEPGVDYHGEWSRARKDGDLARMLSVKRAAIQAGDPEAQYWGR